MVKCIIEIEQKAFNLSDKEFEQLNLNLSDLKSSVEKQVEQFIKFELLDFKELKKELENEK